MNTQHRIEDRGDLRKYRTEIPNIVDEMDLDPYAFRLYVHLKRVAGDSGACWESTETMAQACKMSMGAISNAKKLLVDTGLIIIEEIKNRKGGRDYHNITIQNIWIKNFERFATSSGEVASSLYEVATSPHEVTTSPGELKNKPIKKEPKKNGSLSYVPDFENLPVTQYDRVPELKLFKAATQYYPPSGWHGILLEKIVGVIQQEELSEKDIHVAFQEWVARGFKPDNIDGWLCEWAPAVKRGEKPWVREHRAPQSARPQALSTLEKSLAAGKRAMQKALAEEANLGNKS